MTEKMLSFFENLKNAFDLLYEDVPTESKEQSEENEDQKTCPFAAPIGCAKDL